MYEDLTFFVEPDGTIFTESNYKEELRIFKTVWFGVAMERILTKEAILVEMINPINLSWLFAV